MVGALGVGNLEARRRILGPGTGVVTASALQRHPGTPLNAPHRSARGAGTPQSAEPPSRCSIAETMTAQTQALEDALAGAALGLVGAFSPRRRCRRSRRPSRRTRYADQTGAWRAFRHLLRLNWYKVTGRSFTRSTYPSPSRGEHFLRAGASMVVATGRSLNSVGPYFPTVRRLVGLRGLRPGSELPERPSRPSPWTMSSILRSVRSRGAVDAGGGAADAVAGTHQKACAN